MSDTAFEHIKRLEMYILNILSAFDIDGLERQQQKLLHTIRRQLVDAKLDIRDYEYADTRAEQTRLAKVAIKRLDAVRAGILTASEHDIFSAVDVALLTAQLETIAQDIS